MSNKFKVGDRVVIIDNFSRATTDIDHFETYKFKPATVVDGYAPMCSVLVDGTEKPHPYRNRELEFADIFFSPLYQALK